MHTFRLSKHGLYRDEQILRSREETQSFREFLMALLAEFYVGEEYRFKVVDDLGLACLTTTAVCLWHEPRWARLAPRQRALVFATRSGSLRTDQAYQYNLDRGRRTSPRTFVQTLPNMAAGQVAACFAIRGEYFVLVQEGPAARALPDTIATCLTYGGAQACLNGWVEYAADEELTVRLSVRYAAEKDHSAPPVAARRMARS
ncbi:MAG: hypothetical protein AAFN92_10465 [Bacteroidota bacterium]